MSSADAKPPDPAAWLELPDRRIVPLDRDCYFGRIEGNDILVADARASRRHAVVRREGRRFVLVDLGSTNGTMLNRTRIHKPTELEDGDEIEICGARHVFCQPVAAEPDEDGGPVRTAVFVGKTFCCLLLASGPESIDARNAEWIAQVRQTATRSGARAKTISGATLLAHWRMDENAPAEVRAVFTKIAALARPPGARLTLHAGSVRVGAGANPAEENLLGAEVTFAHKLDGTAAKLGASVLLSEPAVQALELASAARPLGAQAVGEASGTFALFTL